jgi:hypothetical protein
MEITPATTAADLLHLVMRYGAAMRRVGARETTRLSQREADELLGRISAVLPAHTPRRGSDIETWLTTHRDRYDAAAHGTEWLALDWLIDDYRYHADTGAPLSERIVCGPCQGRGCDACRPTGPGGKT